MIRWLEGEWITKREGGKGKRGDGENESSAPPVTKSLPGQHDRSLFRSQDHAEEITDSRVLFDGNH